VVFSVCKYNSFIIIIFRTILSGLNTTKQWSFFQRVTIGGGLSIPPESSVLLWGIKIIINYIDERAQINTKHIIEMYFTLTMF